jgi:hypothetical protein
MENSLLRTAVGTAAMVVLLSVPSVAAAETVVPPGNSAATQYTETFPTTGGNAEVNSTIHGGRHGGGRSPEKVLGSRTTHQLESHGEEGRTLATLASEGAPSRTGEGGEGSLGGKASAGSGGGGQGTGGVGGAGTGANQTTGASLDAQATGGSSGPSEVLSHATGSSSGEMGIFLPLVLLLTPILALAYAWRRRQQQDQVAP